MRYLSHTDHDRRAMLAEIGVNSIDDLFADVPTEARLDGLVDLPKHAGELAVERALSKLAAKNTVAGTVPFFLGAGAYRHHVPASVDHLIQRSEFLTSYTPYQPEVAQGTLQYLFEFQTQVAMITGMDVANASMWDGSTSTAEAVTMACRATRRKKAVLSGNLHSHYRAATTTTTGTLDITLDVAPPAPKDDEDLSTRIGKDTACVVVQYPDMYGHIRDYTALAEKCRENGALLIVVVTEIVALGALRSPGSMGADIVVGEGQSIGNGLNFGGPYLGLFATRQKYLRQMPGRVCGETTDDDGRRGFVLTLSTREQHIRREKATSNICTNAGLCCLAFTIHMSLLGEHGFSDLAKLNHARTAQLAHRIETEVTGASMVNDNFFNEFTIDLGRNAAAVVDSLAAQNVLVGVPVSRLEPDREDLANLLLVAVTETVTDDHMSILISSLQEALS